VVQGKIKLDNAKTFLLKTNEFMLNQAELELKFKEIQPTLIDTFHVSKIGYFGSYARGEQTPESDLDILVEFSQPVGWSFFTLETYLTQKLGLKVDLVTPNALKDRIKNQILNQVIYV